MIEISQFIKSMDSISVVLGRETNFIAKEAANAGKAIINLTKFCEIERLKREKKSKTNLFSV